MWDLDVKLGGITNDSCRPPVSVFGVSEQSCVLVIVSFCRWIEAQGGGKEGRGWTRR